MRRVFDTDRGVTIGNGLILFVAPFVMVAFGMYLHVAGVGWMDREDRPAAAALAAAVFCSLAVARIIAHLTLDPNMMSEQMVYTSGVCLSLNRCESVVDQIDSTRSGRGKLTGTRRRSLEGNTKPCSTRNQIDSNV